MTDTPSRVLLVTPHPDDAEGGCAGTVAGWIKNGAEVSYLLCTNGDKGTGDRSITSDKLAILREKEQLDAARFLGVKDVVFLRYPDGTLEDTRQFRAEVVREIRRQRPDVLMCLDPVKTTGHAHRDHRVSGQVAVDAAFTYAWRRLYFPEHEAQDGLQPHAVSLVYLWGSDGADTFHDISETIGVKAQTLARHASQMSDIDTLEERIRDWAKRIGQRAGLPYAEAFRVMRFNRDPLLAE